MSARPALTEPLALRPMRSKKWVRQDIIGVLGTDVEIGGESPVPGP